MPALYAFTVQYIRPKRLTIHVGFIALVAETKKCSKYFTNVMSVINIKTGPVLPGIGLTLTTGVREGGNGNETEGIGFL